MNCIATRPDKDRITATGNMQNDNISRSQTSPVFLCLSLEPNVQTSDVMVVWFQRYDRRQARIQTCTEPQTDAFITITRFSVHIESRRTEQKWSLRTGVVDTCFPTGVHSDRTERN